MIVKRFFPGRSTSMLTVAVPLLCLWGPARFAASQSVNAPVATNSRERTSTSHSDRSIAALDIAILAAKSNLNDVALEALSRAVREGPPVQTVDIGGLFSRGEPSRSASPRSQQREQHQRQTAQVKLAKRMIKLNRVWKQRDLEPAQIYKAWKGVVMPEQRTGEIHGYSTATPFPTSISYGSVPIDVERPERAASVAEALVDWAQRAGRIEELEAEVARRAQAPSGQDSAVLLQSMIILAQHDHAKLEGLCDTVIDDIGGLLSRPDSQILIQQLDRMIDTMGWDSDKSRQLMKAILAALPHQSNWQSNPWLEYLVAREIRNSIDDNALERFRVAAQVTLSRYASLSANSRSYVISKERQFYRVALRRALAAGSFQIGLECVRSAPIWRSSDTYGDATLRLLEPTGSLSINVLRLPRDDRYRMLKDSIWSASDLGLVDQAMLMPRVPIPDAIRQNLDDPQNEFAASGIINDSKIGLSLADLIMRDAIALGKQTDLEAQIKQLEERQSDNSRLAKLIYRSAQDKKLDLALLRPSDGNGMSPVDAVLGPDEHVTTLDLEALHQFADSGADRKQIQDVIEARLTAAAAKNQNGMLIWLRHFQFAFDAQHGKTHTTHKQLKHWMTALAPSATSSLKGLPPESVWLKRGEGAWGHQFGRGTSHLILRYPLHGEFTVAWRQKDGDYQEGGVSLAGHSFEFEGNRGYLRMRAVGGRNTHYNQEMPLNKRGFTPMVLMRTADQVTLSINDGQARHERQASSGYPFLSFYSAPQRYTTVDSIVVEGNYTIPRAVSLVSRRLIGWSAGLMGQRLPSADEVPKPLASLDGEQRKSLDWYVDNDEILSIDQATETVGDAVTNDQPTNSGLIQYMRPMGDGEEITLEFYYQPDRYCIAPALGRIAVILGEADVPLHWITTLKEATWSGVSPDNRFTDSAAIDHQPVELQAHAWNSLTVRRQGSSAIFKVNGQQVLQRVWEDLSGWQFGLFHDPEKYQVRVRNVVLRGENWPQTLPSDLFERKVATSHAAVE